MAPSRSLAGMLRNCLCGLLLAFACGSAGVAFAHEIPPEVRLQAYLAEEGNSLNVLLRVPLQAMRDIEFAQHGPGYLDLEAAEKQLADAVSLWLAGELNFDLDGEPLGAPELAAVRLALPSDSSFASYERARRAIASERIPAGTELYWEQALLDVHLRYPLPDASGELFFAPTLARLGLRTVLEVRLLKPGEAPQSFVFLGDPGRVSLTPGIGSVFSSFLEDGFLHVLGGMDHLLFLAALILPVRRLRPLVVVVTAFTLAHSITLSAAAFGLVPEAAWFVPLVEILVAASIVFMALENIIKPGLKRRWLIAYLFGLIHGFAFSFTLTDMLQFSAGHLTTALLAFNLGIEFGQLLVLLLVFPLLRLLFARLPRQPLLIVLSALVAHSGWHWLTERFELLAQFSFDLPQADAVFLAAASSWLLLALIALLIAWLVNLVLARHGWDT